MVQSIRITPDLRRIPAWYAAQAGILLVLPILGSILNMIPSRISLVAFLSSE
jgi:hypothetical protein